MPPQGLLSARSFEVSEATSVLCWILRLGEALIFVFQNLVHNLIEEKIFALEGIEKREKRVGGDSCSL
ncbi:hypothetical protein L6164_031370 [Bauhinia variegata]|uniref:Uncharacterized protein n=1 Tax=Bauhinia variegata TaxID=167791 RepID=A0ACB9LFF2_BAUVA|nr:hypothetical protein L6164_031370 [Bauhinia variegata]